MRRLDDLRGEVRVERDEAPRRTRTGGVLEEAIAEGNRPMLEQLKRIGDQLELLTSPARMTPAPGTLPAFNTLAQAAAKMGRNAKTLRNYIDDGLLHATRPYPGAPYVVTDEEIDRCMRGLNAPGGTEKAEAGETSVEDLALKLINRRSRRGSK